MLFVSTIRSRIRKKGPSTAFLRALVLVALVGLASMPSAVAEDANGKWIDFDIPAQSLAGALNAYGSVTHVQLFVDAALTSGRRSAALHGVFAPEAGLLALIAGTGLTAFPIGDEGFTLVPLHDGQGEGGDEQAQPSQPPKARRFAEYSAELQRDLTTTLCQHEETRPGSYRTLVRFWIDSSGSVTQAELLTSTGDRERDARLLSVLRNLTVSGSPPPDLPQPITLLLAPGAKPADDYCPPANPRSRRADVTP
jgi:TonB family protein